MFEEPEKFLPSPVARSFMVKAKGKTLLKK
jgi:hypothetical protein